MTCKKIIANLLLSTALMNGFFSKIQARVNQDEWTEIYKIENARHDVGSKDLLLKKIIDNLKEDPNSNIALYYQSILYRLGHNAYYLSDKNFNDEALYDKEFFATLLYRTLEYKIAKNAIDPQILFFTENFLYKKINVMGKPDPMDRLNLMDELSILKICLICSKYKLLNESLLGDTLRKVGTRALTKKDKNLKILLILGKIPHNADTQITALTTVIREMNGIENAAKCEQGKDALITLGKIPQYGDKKRIAALNTAIDAFDGGVEGALECDQGRDALITLGKIPGNAEKQIEVLTAVINKLGGVKGAAKCYQGKDALITLGKVPHNDKKQIAALTAVIDELGGVKGAAKCDQGKDALIALGRIRNCKERIENLTAVIDELGGVEGAAKCDQGKDALLVYSKIPDVDSSERIKALEKLSELKDSKLTREIRTTVENIQQYCQPLGADDKNAIKRILENMRLPKVRFSARDSRRSFKK